MAHTAPTRSRGNETSHSWALASPSGASPPLVAKVLPSGLNATRAREMSAGVIAGPIRCWVVTFHNCTVPSALPLATVAPSGLNATELT